MACSQGTPWLSQDILSQWWPSQWSSSKLTQLLSWHNRRKLCYNKECVTGALVCADALKTFTRVSEVFIALLEDPHVRKHFILYLYLNQQLVKSFLETNSNYIITAGPSSFVVRDTLLPCSICRLHGNLLWAVFAVWHLFKNGRGLLLCHMLSWSSGCTEDQTQGAGKHSGRLTDFWCKD